MSNFTDFFPSAAGTAEITNPDKLPLSFIATGSTSSLPYMWHSFSNFSGTPNYSNDTTDDLILGTGSNASPYNGTAVQSVNGTEYTLLNITSGSGYLCNVATAITERGTTMNQKIVIIVDGTTYTYDYNAGIDTTFDGFYNRLFWGFFAGGSSSQYNHMGDSATTGLMGNGGGPIYGNSSLPTFMYTLSSNSYSRVFSAHEFKMYNLPRLRFESSLVVKVTTSNLYTTTGYAATGGATYYLDSTPI